MMSDCLLHCSASAIDPDCEFGRRGLRGFDKLWRATQTANDGRDHAHHRVVG